MAHSQAELQCDSNVKDGSNRMRVHFHFEIFYMTSIFRFHMPFLTWWHVAGVCMNWLNVATQDSILQ